MKRTRRRRGVGQTLLSAGDDADKSVRITPRAAPAGSPRCLYHFRETQYSHSRENLSRNTRTMTAHERTRITYRYERLRAVAAGVVESAAASFLLLIALRWFDAGA